MATYVDLIQAAGQTGAASAEPRLQSIVELMKDAKLAGHAPCLELFRSAGIAVAFCARNKFGQEFCLKLLSEMHNCGLDPCDSPGLLSSLIEVFYPSQSSSPNGFLPVLLKELEKSFTGKSPSAMVKHPKDREFASNIMLKACEIFHDAEMALKIHNLLTNYRPGLLMFADVNKETAYYSALLSVLARGDTVERLMDIYNSVVPSKWLPSPNIFAQIVDAVELQRHFNLLPSLWQDCARMRLPYGFPFLVERFAVAFDKASSANIEDAELYKNLVHTAINMVDHAEYGEVARLARGVTLSPNCLSVLFKLAVHEKVVVEDSLLLADKVAALCQRLRLPASAVLQQHSQRRSKSVVRETKDQNQMEKLKNAVDFEKHLTKIAAAADQTLPSHLSNWLGGTEDSNKTLPEKENRQREGGRGSRIRRRQE